MRQPLTERYRERLAGVLSCYDRIIVIGTLPVSIEVDDLSDVHRRMQAAGFRIEYGPVSEPWGVTRFYVRDPFGRLVNVLAHE